tara:strand:+ start:306 stop:1379 length:1074 start_codon:yes stop_codon:yes gene_type:complete
MSLPKKIKKHLNIVPGPIQPHYPQGYDGTQVPNRRKELFDLINDDGTFLPKSLLHADLDRGMLDFVQNELQTVTNGKKINVIDRILTLQRWAEFSQTWQFSTSDKNVDLPFIVVVRNPDVQYGSNPALQYTIPDRKQFHYAKVPTWDGNRKGYDVYTIPQPVPVDIIYDVKIICNRMRELNTFNKITLQKFTSRQAYTFVKGHYIPIVMQSIGDESKIDTEERRYYQQSYQFQLQGFLLDEEEFEVKPAINRSLVLYGFDEQNRKREKKNLGEKNPDKVRTVIEFDDVTTIKTIDYVYKNDITVMRTSNIDSVTFTIDGVTLDSPVQVNGGDTLTITITKTNPGSPSKLIIQEKLVR